MKFQMLEDNTTIRMYDILINNLNVIYPNFKEKDNDYEDWEEHSKNKEVVVLYEDKKAYAFLMYVDNFICEIQIDNKHKQDKISFRNLLKKYLEAIDIKDETKISCIINPYNKKAVQVFSGIGFQQIQNNNYQIDAKKLKDWIIMKNN